MYIKIISTPKKNHDAGAWVTSTFASLTLHFILALGASFFALETAPIITTVVLNLVESVAPPIEIVPKKQLKYNYLFLAEKKPDIKPIIQPKKTAIVPTLPKPIPKETPPQAKPEVKVTTAEISPAPPQPVTVNGIQFSNIEFVRQPSNGDTWELPNIRRLDIGENFSGRFDITCEFTITNDGFVTNIITDQDEINPQVAKKIKAGLMELHFFAGKETRVRTSLIYLF